MHDGRSHGSKRTQPEYLLRSLFSVACDVVAVDGLVRVVAGSVPVVVFVFFRWQLAFVLVLDAVLPSQVVFEAGHFQVIPPCSGQG